MTDNGKIFIMKKLYKDVKANHPCFVRLGKKQVIGVYSKNAKEGDTIPVQIAGIATVYTEVR